MRIHNTHSTGICECGENSRAGCEINTQRLGLFFPRPRFRSLPLYAIPPICSFTLLLFPGAAVYIDGQNQGSRLSLGQFQLKSTGKMTFRAVEDRPTPKEVYNIRLYFEASVIAMGSLL